MTPHFDPSVRSIVLVNQIITGLRHRYASLNTLHYEAAWTDSWTLVRCFHKHPTLSDAAKCGMPHPGFYVVAVDAGEPRELTKAEEGVVNRVRFAGLRK